VTTRPLPSAGLPPDLISDALDVVFVTIAAGEGSGGDGHHYSDPHERFWDLVNESGLVSDLVGAENDHLILDEKCGLALLREKEPGAGADKDGGRFNRQGLTGLVERYKPKVVAFNGPGVYREVFGRVPADFGLTEDIIGDSYVFALPSSDERDTSLPYQKKLHWYRKLKATMKSL